MPQDPASAAAEVVTQLYESWYSAMVRFASRSLRNVELAEELVQDSFMALYAELAAGRRIEHPRAWVMRVVRRAIWRQFGARADEQLAHECLDVVDRSCFVSPSAVDEAGELAALLGCLSPREEEAVLLRAAGLDYSQIAAELGLASGTVGTLLSCRGKPFLSGCGMAAAIVGGWTVTGITTLQKGRPVELTAPNNTNSFGGGSRPNNNGQAAALPSGERTLERWFNTSVFSQPEPFTFGNTGRLLPDVREAGITNFDLSVHKRFPIRERLNLEFRAEMFNAFNTPQFGRPNGSFGNVQFGTINTQANSPREIQFGVKLIF